MDLKKELNRQERHHLGMNKNKYPGFDYSGTDLKRFHEAAGIFTILLGSSEVIHFEPENPIEFKSWLKKFEIADASLFLL